MTASLSREPPGSAVRVISRRNVVQQLALALASLPAGELFADDGRPLPPVAGAQQPGPVTFLDAAALRRAIRTAPEENAGQPGLYSLRLSAAVGHPVIGIRRTAPTRSEVHAAFTDVWYVLEGSGTLVTGGAIVGGVETAVGEVRGRSIVGGDSRQIRAGDFAVVPAGVPHWVSRVGARELLYLVVKVPSPR